MDVMSVTPNVSAAACTTARASCAAIGPAVSIITATTNPARRSIIPSTKRIRLTKADQYVEVMSLDSHHSPAGLAV